MSDPYETRLPDALAVPTDAETPEHIGRYRIIKALGKGGFGTVYLAKDEQLDRSVAIKVPHRDRLTSPHDAANYVSEARNAAALDHPNIVPVYDITGDDDWPLVIVSKYIDGVDLAMRLQRGKLSLRAGMEIVAAVAAALHHAHKHGLVHRDVKPRNILLDRSGTPYVTDFGLALRDRDFGHGPAFAGTPAYMSPEQARGEGHRVDGRSDIFSLGIVLYELLTGRRPFVGESVDELLDQILSVEGRPPRQIDDRIPKELERICLKALAKRASDRYTTAHDFADDLRQFLAGTTSTDAASITAQSSQGAAVDTPMPGPATPTPSDWSTARIVPRGLRSFDAADAGFFLELLPGPRNRNGLPESIHFWKSRIESTDAEDTFDVGLIYGPSGCGKSSLVKAGLLPRLSEAVTVVYVEAAADTTEARLLAAIRKRHPDVSPTLSLKETLGALRLGPAAGPAGDGKKGLIVLDQFEQWLHAHHDEANTELVQALRQCDGVHVQCLLLVRDDFWLAVSRCMRDLEIDLVPGRNIALVDLFDLDHARKVLAAFGRAFGKLPEHWPQLSKEQQEFLTRAATELAEDGKVVCVRLAVFAEMMKSRAWNPAALKQVGGAAGLGVTFLEETFASPAANPQHRLHQAAARAVLKSLLPEAGAAIKGHMRSHAELLAASGYANRPRDFDALLRILDGELRLITPSEAEGSEPRLRLCESPEPSANPQAATARHYQLTHDYLVPPLRDWLTRKQRETWRGRAELALADYAAVWNARPEHRQLPSLLLWATIRLLTPSRNWTEPERRLIAKATHYHGLRCVTAATLLAALACLAAGFYSHYRAREERLLAGTLVEALAKMPIAEVPGQIEAIQKVAREARPRLQAQYDSAGDDSPTKLRASLALHALSPDDATHVEYLLRRLLAAEPHEVAVIRDALAVNRAVVTARLWAVVKDPPQPKQRLRAGAALAAYEPQAPQWHDAATAVATDLVNSAPADVAVWLNAFRQIGDQLYAPLALVFRNAELRETPRSVATDLLAHFAGGQPQLLAELIVDADAKQFAVLFPKLAQHGGGAVPPLRHILQTEAADEADQDRTAKRQATAAVALLRLDKAGDAWPKLKVAPDPRMRSYIIDRLGAFGAPVAPIAGQIDSAADDIRLALILSLGGFDDPSIAPVKEELSKQLLVLYREHSDPGVHSASEWLLRRLTHQSDIPEREQLRKESAERHAAIVKAITNGERKRRWYVNVQGQTMVVLPGPAEVILGSPPSDEDREGGPKGLNEKQARATITRAFAIAATEVTVKEFLRFLEDDRATAADPQCPMNNMNWYEAAGYCNFLSELEGIDPKQWCYEKNADAQYARGMKVRPDFLNLTGYRLPTDAEWEYACRGGAVTRRSFGDSDDLLEKYACYQKNSMNKAMFAVGSLKPNDFGLFDMLGNAMEWCHSPFDYHADGEDAMSNYDRVPVGHTVAKYQGYRVFRGGSYLNRAAVLRCANRGGALPDQHLNSLGFRVARTIR